MDIQTVRQTERKEREMKKLGLKVCLACGLKLFGGFESFNKQEK